MIFVDGVFIGGADDLVKLERLGVDSLKKGRAP